MRIFGREPAAWLAFLAVVVEMAVAYGIHLTEQEQAGINAVATGAFGFALAWSVAREKAIPIAAGLVTAVLQLAVAFGVHLSAHQVATAGALVTAGLAFWLHGKVTAPIDANGSRVPPVTLVSSRRV